MQNAIISAREPAYPSHHQPHPALTNFSFLPNEAFVPLPVVCALFSCAPATVWRRVRKGLLVSPHRIGLRTTRWNVGELRQALNEENK